MKTRESLVGPAKWRNSLTRLMQQTKQNQSPPALCLSASPFAAGFMDESAVCWCFLGCATTFLAFPAVSQPPHCNRTSLTSTSSLTTAASYEGKINLHAGQTAKTDKVFVLLLLSGSCMLKGSRLKGASAAAEQGLNVPADSGSF